MSDVKRCWKCRTVKLLTDFSPSARTSNGAMCRSCFSMYMRERNASKIPLQRCLSCNLSKSVVEYRRSQCGWQKVCRECERTVLCCQKCGMVKTHNQFPASDDTSTGRAMRCRECKKADWRNNRITPKAKQRKKEYKLRPDVKEKSRVWFNKYLVNRRRNDPVFKWKERARSAVNLAVRKKELTKPLTCQHPGKYTPVCSGEIQAHHYKGYDRENWLNVEWLCVTCHQAADIQQKDTQ